MMTPAMLLDLLPKPVIALLAAGFLGVDLSSFAVMALAPATLISHDMYTLYKPNATEKQKSTLITRDHHHHRYRIIAICNFQPAVVDMVNWCFSFGIPVFIMGVIGLWWKRSTKASVITFIITWIAVCIWSTFGLQDASADGPTSTLHYIATDRLCSDRWCDHHRRITGQKRIVTGKTRIKEEDIMHMCVTTDSVYCHHGICNYRYRLCHW